MLRTSIAMTTFNGVAFLQQQLDSFSEQTRLPDELVVCDDGSTDETVSILEAFAITAPFPVRVVVNPINLGYIKNFLKAISLCDGDLVFLSDQDDIWRKDKIDHFVETAFDLKQKPSLIFSDAQIIDASNKSSNQTLWKILKITGTSQDYKDLRYRNIVTGATCAVNRKLIDVIEKYEFPAHVPHDHSITLLAWSIGQIKAIDQRFVSYRIHENNQIGINRTFLDGVRTALRSLKFDHTKEEGLRCLEIAIFLQKVDRKKAKIFWRKAAYYRLMNSVSPWSFILINYRYHNELFRNHRSLIRIILSTYLRRFFRMTKFAN